MRDNMIDNSYNFGKETPTIQDGEELLFPSLIKYYFFLQKIQMFS